MTADEQCKFCTLIASGPTETWVLEDDWCVAFLDHRPVFLGHCLLVPREHHQVLSELPPALVAPVFADVQLLTQAVEASMEADGSFVAMNNRISQSVPHLHVHVVPRRRGDGLRGFFWPRQRYRDEDQPRAIATEIRHAVTRLKSEQSARNERSR